MRQTLLLFVTLPPGTVAHALPVQYCASNAVTHCCEQVCVAVGSHVQLSKYV
ncbi:MAG: hypothetical protein ACJ74W_11840 [Pyrinomonadaceae bacterium]